MTTAKILLAIAAGFVLLIALIIGGALLFIHFTVDEHFEKDVAQSRQEGANFGKTTDQAGCLNEGLKRSKNIPLASSFKDKNTLAAFVKYCLPESRPTKNFCEAVPASYNFGRTEKWKTEQCESARLDEISSSCGFVFEEQITFCSK